MNATIRRMASLAEQASTRLSNKSLESLVTVYREETEVIGRSVVVALCWQKLLGITISVSDPFYSLSPEEKSSIATMAIVKTIERYRVGEGTKVSTLFHTIYRRGLITALKRDTSKYTLEDIADYEHLGEEVDYDLDTGTLLARIKLWLGGGTEAEKMLAYCTMVMANEFDTISELAEQLGVSRTTIYAYQRKLKVLLEEHGITG